MSGQAAKVLYRGPPGMKKELYYFVGAVFTGTGCYQGYLLSQHLTLPTTRDWSNAELSSPVARYVVGTAVAITGASLGFFFMYSPSRLGTRVTFYPATQTVGIRTATRPLRAFLPPSLRRADSTPINPLDVKEQLFPWEMLYRRDGTSAVEIERYGQGKSIPVATAQTSKKRKVPSSILLGKANAIGFQLEAAPVSLHQAQTKNMYKQGWANFKLGLRGKTDWSPVAGETGLSGREEQAKLTMHPKDPWFLDRPNFDRLFPTRQR